MQLYISLASPSGRKSRAVGNDRKYFPKICDSVLLLLFVVAVVVVVVRDGGGG